MDNNHWMSEVAREARIAAKTYRRHWFETIYVPSLPEFQHAFALEKMSVYAAKIEAARHFTAETWIARMNRRPYHRAGLVSISEVVANVGGSVIVNGIPATCNSWRIKLYAAKGVKCVRCGLEGTTFAVERAKGQDTEKHHLNLYHVDEKGEETMITVDHIIPKSKGGGNEMSNLQPMCITCNGHKADKIEGEAA